MKHMGSLSLSLLYVSIYRLSEKLRAAGRVVCVCVCARALARVRVCLCLCLCLPKEEDFQEAEDYLPTHTTLSLSGSLITCPALRQLRTYGTFTQSELVFETGARI